MICESVLGLEHTGGIVRWHSTVCSFDVVQFACLCSVSVELACLQTLFWPAGISFLENEGFFWFYYEDVQSLCLMWIIVCWSDQSCCVRNSSLEVLSGKCPCESTTFLRAVWESGCQLGWFDCRDGLSGKGTNVSWAEARELWSQLQCAGQSHSTGLTSSSAG